ncbi:hypothetical protein VZ94_20605 [Methylocucumis oryzae]|uniref:FAD/NAD(P)-binding domain-containing protein n=2 Tax=Methylocucumis oryzae TaxID=1632867 RepID=A0A0F3II26_9GAMM|nr:hypothetical protein VZ94_20605 [Methylocucumis oryzae]
MLKTANCGVSVLKHFMFNNKEVGMSTWIKKISLGIALGLTGHCAYALTSLSCHVAIVGGGPGGVHTAYQLAKLPKDNPDSNVCLFEKETKVGGRFR